MSNAEEKSSKASTDMLPLQRERNRSFIKDLDKVMKIMSNQSLPG